MPWIILIEHNYCVENPEVVEQVLVEVDLVAIVVDHLGYRCYLELGYQSLVVDTQAFLFPFAATNVPKEPPISSLLTSAIGKKSGCNLKTSEKI